jgi:predicted MFS family arabinose efflux permease
MALTAVSLEGAAAGSAIVAALILFSLARGLCSVSAKDVLGKTVSKSRRGVLMGYSAGIAGLATLALGLYLGLIARESAGSGLFAGLLLGGAGLWFVAAGVFVLIQERPGATEGGGNALSVAFRSLGLLRSDPPFRAFVITRVLLLGVALAPPFYVLLAQAHTEGGVAGLGMLIVASGLAGSLSAPIWGRLADRSARLVIAIAAAFASMLGVALWFLETSRQPVLDSAIFHAAVFALLTLFHSGVRLGRKVYLVDMAGAGNRAVYVALSNSVVGVAMLAAGLVGVLADRYGPAGAVLLLSLLCLFAAGRAWRLPEVSG